MKSLPLQHQLLHILELSEMLQQQQRQHYSHFNSTYVEDGEKMISLHDHQMFRVDVGNLPFPEPLEYCGVVPEEFSGFGEGGDRRPVVDRATGAVEAKKRKSLNEQSGVQVCSDITENSSRGKRKKGDPDHKQLSEMDPKLEIHQSNNKNKNNSTSSSINSNNESRKGSIDRKSSSKVPTPRTDYILVRARRGEATDSHSLAERVRREKISERMKYLQDLVPGCNKITGKAGMLDEIINYVQSLQRQVEFLSMKLATLNPLPDFISYSFYGKEILSGSSNIIQIGEMPLETLNRRDLQFSPLQQLITSTCQGSIPELDLQGGTPNAYSEPIFPNATPSVQECITWDSTTNVPGGGFCGMDQQVRQSSFPFQFFGGSKDGGM